MGWKVTAKIDGLDSVLRSLDGLRRSTQNRILRPPIGKASRMLAKRVKTNIKAKLGHNVAVQGRDRFGHFMSVANARKSTGLLYRSIGAAVRTGRRGGSVYAVIGPRKGFKEVTGVKETRRLIFLKGSKTLYADPVRYAHFSELGTVHEPARPWLRPALESSRGEIRAIIAAGIREGLAKLAAKGGR